MTSRNEISSAKLYRKKDIRYIIWSLKFHSDFSTLSNPFGFKILCNPNEGLRRLNKFALLARGKLDMTFWMRENPNVTKISAEKEYLGPLLSIVNKAAKNIFFYLTSNFLRRSRPFF